MSYADQLAGLRHYPGPEERTALYDILDAEFDEVSVVDRGDNPHAKIVFWKRHPEAEGELLTEQEINKAIDEVAAERGGLQKLDATTITKATDATARIMARAEEIEKATGVDRAEAISQAMNENAGLMQKYMELRDEQPFTTEDQPIDPVERAASRQAAELRKAREMPATTEFLGKVAEIKKSNPTLSEGEAWGKAEVENPELLARAHKEDRPTT